MDDSLPLPSEEDFPGLDEVADEAATMIEDGADMEDLLSELPDEEEYDSDMEEGSDVSEGEEGSSDDEGGSGGEEERSALSGSSSSGSNSSEEDEEYYDEDEHDDVHYDDEDGEYYDEEGTYEGSVSDGSEGGSSEHVTEEGGSVEAVVH